MFYIPRYGDVPLNEEKEVWAGQISVLALLKRQKGFLSVLNFHLMLLEIFLEYRIIVNLNRELIRFFRLLQL